MDAWDEDAAITLANARGLFGATTPRLYSEFVAAGIPTRMPTRAQRTRCREIH